MAAQDAAQVYVELFVDRILGYSSEQITGTMYCSRSTSVAFSQARRLRSKYKSLRAYTKLYGVYPAPNQIKSITRT